MGLSKTVYLFFVSICSYISSSSSILFILLSILFSFSSFIIFISLFFSSCSFLFSSAFNSFLEEDENENANRNKEEKSYIQNNPKNKIKSENIFATPNKTNDYNQRITSRKIVRKTNNIFIQKNNKRDSINDEYNREISNINNNGKNNFFHSIILSSVKKEKDNDN